VSPVKKEKYFWPSKKIMITEKELKSTEGNLTENTSIPNQFIQKCIKTKCRGGLFSFFSISMISEKLPWE
jgi:hypothetical protein